MSAELEMQLRLQYGMAIVRLVNGISDSSQKGKVANSVAVLATKSGDPASQRLLQAFPALHCLGSRHAERKLRGLAPQSAYLNPGQDVLCQHRNSRCCP